MQFNEKEKVLQLFSESGRENAEGYLEACSSSRRGCPPVNIACSSGSWENKQQKPPAGSPGGGLLCMRMRSYFFARYLRISMATATMMTRPWTI